MKQHDPTTNYALDVVEGKIIAGPLVRLACKRHLNDIERQEEKGLFWDVEQSNWVMNFFPEILRLAGGEHEGKKFYLEPCQQFIVGSIFGWKIRADMTRRFRVAFIEMGKGSGKSPLAAGIGMYMFTSDREPRAEVYAAAVDKDQAQILFRDAVAMRHQSPVLAAALATNGQGGREWNMYYPKTGSFFRPISSDHKGTGQSGPRPHCALLDEVHEHPTRAMVEYMRAGTKGRRQALIFMITNSGFDRTTVCWDYHKKAERVLTNVLEDDAFFAYVCGLDEGDDWRDEKVWIKSNPLLGVSIPVRYLREQVNEAKGMPSKQSIVRRLNFCEWTEGESGWLAQEVWEACQTTLNIEHYYERKCCGAVDLSSKRDLTALSLIFELDDATKAAFVWFFMPGDDVKVREDRDGAPYSLWRDQGFIEATPGPVVDYSFVADKIAQLAENVEILGLACDAYKRDMLQAELDELNCEVPLINHPQGFRKVSDSELWMPASVEATEEAIVKQILKINHNPCLDWNAASVTMTESPEGNKKPDKRKATGRIDGVVALIQAMGVASNAPQPMISVYEHRGLLML